MEKVKISHRKEKAIETKNKIYATAKQLFKEYGFENVSVDSIVKATGVSKGTFYVHFESKDTLASTLINDFVNEVDLDYKSYLETINAETSVSDTLILLLGKITDIIAFSIGYESIKTLYKAYMTKTIETDTTTSYKRELYKMFNRILEDGIRKGEFREDMSVDTLSKHCIFAIRGITYEWCIRYPDFDLKKQTLEHFEILLKGIKKQ